MKNALLFSLLAALAGLSHAAPVDAPDHVRVRIHCKTVDDKCPTPPPPPAPPAAPPPPPPPVQRAARAGDPVPPVAPVPPAPPAPPAAPPAPKIPPVPAGAQAACAAKAAGSTVVWQLGEGEVMRGSCARKDGKMTFKLESYALER